VSIISREGQASLISSTRPALTSASAPFAMTRRFPLFRNPFSWSDLHQDLARDSLATRAGSARQVPASMATGQSRGVFRAARTAGQKKFREVKYYARHFGVYSMGWPAALTRMLQQHQDKNDR
jgi:hypothetical protein